MAKKNEVKNNRIDWRIVATGMCCLTLVELCALANGINGTILTIYVGVIAAAIGVSIDKDKILK